MNLRLPFVWTAPLFLLLAGCESEPRNVGNKAAATPAPAAAAPAKDTFIVGKTTQDIGKAEVEKAKGGQVASQKITARDPITLPGNAYVTIVGRTSIDNMKHAVDLYQAETGEYPKTYEEFMEKIVKPNSGGIRLPVLPHYQKYVYDAPEHTLKVMEYPELKNAPPQ